MRIHGHRRALACWMLLLATGVWAQESEPEDTAVEEASAHHVSGTLSAPDGNPVPAATVWVRVADQRPLKKHQRDDWFEPVSTKTDDAGRFSLSLEAAGPYRVCALHAEHPPLVVDEDVLDGEPVELAFLEVFEFSGEVRETDGTPVAGADVLACVKDAQHLQSEVAGGVIVEWLGTIEDAPSGLTANDLILLTKSGAPEPVLQALMAAVRREALKIVEEGVGTKEDVNLAMTLGFRWPAGPFPQGPSARSGWK